MTLAKSARAKPTLRYHDGGLLSNVHCWNFPSSALPSIAMTTCGLIQSTFVRVPVTDIRLVISKTDDTEWCAHKGGIPAQSAPVTTTVRAQYFDIAFHSSRRVSTGSTAAARRAGT